MPAYGLEIMRDRYRAESLDCVGLRGPRSPENLAQGWNRSSPTFWRVSRKLPGRHRPKKFTIPGLSLSRPCHPVCKHMKDVDAVKRIAAAFPKLGLPPPANIERPAPIQLLPIEDKPKSKTLGRHVSVGSSESGPKAANDPYLDSGVEPECTALASYDGPQDGVPHFVTRALHKARQQEKLTEDEPDADAGVNPGPLPIGSTLVLAKAKAKVRKRPAAAALGDEEVLPPHQGHDEAPPPHRGHEHVPPPHQGPPIRATDLTDDVELLRTLDPWMLPQNGLLGRTDLDRMSS